MKILLTLHKLKRYLFNKVVNKSSYSLKILDKLLASRRRLKKGNVFNFLLYINIYMISFFLSAFYFVYKDYKTLCFDVLIRKSKS